MYCVLVSPDYISSCLSWQRFFSPVPSLPPTLVPSPTRRQGFDLHEPRHRGRPDREWQYFAAALKPAMYSHPGAALCLARGAAWAFPLIHGIGGGV